MNEPSTRVLILPYSRIVGQDSAKRALELAHIAPAVGGVLLSGERGTGKSTLVRAFCQMLRTGSNADSLPVTLPINATEDRVIGGWDVNALVQGEAKWRPGLLEEADGRLLYVDEINLLDDHIVNIILDVTSTGVLVVQREGKADRRRVRLTLVGTMNPEEGGLRPQLLDRFGFNVIVGAVDDLTQRTQILANVVAFDAVLREWRATQTENLWLTTALAEDAACQQALIKAAELLPSVAIADTIVTKIVKLAQVFRVEGHRADYTIAMAARANAARDGRLEVSDDDLRTVAPIVLRHRRAEALHSDRAPWGETETAKVESALAGG